MEVTTPDKFESAFSGATKTRSDALAVTLSGLFSSHQKLIVSLATRSTPLETGSIVVVRLRPT